MHQRDIKSPSERAIDRLFIPDLCAVRAVFVLVLMAEVLAVVLTLSSAREVTEGLNDLALKSLFIQWVTLSCAVFLCLIRPLLSRLSESMVAIVAHVSALAVTWLVSELAWRTLSALDGAMPLAAASSSGFLLRNMLIAALVSALVLRYLYVHHHWRRRIESESEARIQALQSRIQPHFLFNCMNTIASLTRKRPDLAEEAVEDLADLFRATLLPARDRVTLSQELGLCRQYLRTEALRLQDRLTVNWQIDALPGDALVPVLSIQPLIENAIYHGIETLKEGGAIKITGHREGRKLSVEIENPMQATADRSSHAGNRLAQHNVEQRLQAFYGAAGRLEIDAADDYYRVRLSVPYERNEDADPYRRR